MGRLDRQGLSGAKEADLSADFPSSRSAQEADILVRACQDKRIWLGKEEQNAHGQPVRAAPPDQGALGAYLAHVSRRLRAGAPGLRTRAAIGKLLVAPLATRRPCFELLSTVHVSSCLPALGVAHGRGAGRRP